MQRSAPTENERELNDSVNVNASEANKEASGAAATQTETESPTGRNSALKIKQAKKKTSPGWKHFNEIFVEENVDDMVIKKAMAACMYCDDVLPAPSNQVRHAYGIITIHFMMMPKRNLA